MRLTLRTLLAYLDDTLDPSEIKVIGQKVAESDAAQELVARIKQVVRRRRLIAPPVHGGAKLEANMVAEYLDNELTSEQQADLEKVCLDLDGDSDTYLAEVAACHQILTLVLGEPAMVPPTAKERMYALVRGKEADASRKAPPRRKAVLEDDGHYEEASPLLDFSGAAGRSWMRWAVPLAGLFLLLGVGVALYFALPRLPAPTQGETQVAQIDTGKDSGKADGTPDKDAGKSGDVGTTPEKPPEGTTPVTTPEKPPEGTTPPVTTPEKPPEGTTPEKPPEGTTPEKPPAGGLMKPDPPSQVRAVAGTYHVAPGQPSILVQQQETGWRRLPPNSDVATVDTLVSLPGYTSEVRTPGGARLLLRGHLPQMSLHPLMDFLLDSAVRLHENKDFDLDLTFLRGRIYLSSHRADGPVRVRLRFWDEVWDLTLLDPDTEVGVDLLTHYTRDINYLDGEEPRAELYLCLLRGKASLHIDTFEYPSLEAPAGGGVVFNWDNKGPRSFSPQRVPKWPLPIWEKAPPDTEGARGMRPALTDLSRLMTEKKGVDVVLKEELAQPMNVPLRLLCIYSLAAIDEVGQLIDVLDSQGDTAAVERDFALYALRRWISRDASHGKRLFDPRTRTGALIDKKYPSNDAEIMLALLHDLSEGKADQQVDLQLKIEALLRYLRHDRTSIRHMAHWLLVRMTPELKEKPPFNAGWPDEARNKAWEEWRRAVEQAPPPARKPPPRP